MEIRNSLPINNSDSEVQSPYKNSSGYLLLRLLRLSVAIIFLLSGFLKAYSLQATSDVTSQYYDLLGIPHSKMLAYYSGISICYYEILIGLLALNRVLYRRLLPLYLLTAIAFTYITFINLYSPFGGIQSCGCFGELIVMSPTESFIKNILIVGIMILTAITYHSTCTTKVPYNGKMDLHSL